jgi:ATP-binding cassette subfamily B protein
LAETVTPQSLPLRAYRALLGRYLAPQKTRVALMAALLLVGIALQLANPQIIGYFLDTAQAGGGSRPLLIAATLFISFALLQQGMALAAGYVSQSVGWTATLRLRADLTLHCLRLDMPFYGAHTPGEMIDRIDGDAGALANFLSRFSVNVLGNALLVAGIIALLALRNPWLGLGMLLYALATVQALRAIQRLAVPRRAAQRQAEALLYGYIEERIGGAEDIRAAGAQPYALRQLHALLRTSAQKARAALVVGGLAYSLTRLVYGLGYAAALAISVILYTRGQATLGVAYMVTYYIGMLSEPLQAIRAEIQDLQQASASIQRIGSLLEEHPASDPLPGDGETLPSGPLSVTFEQVDFDYAAVVGAADVSLEENGTEDDGAIGETAVQALTDVTFSLEPGRVLGILGRTGSGKSTITRLLIRLYAPTRGSVRLGGLRQRHAAQVHAAVADLRRRVGLVTQDVQLFQASLRDNLTFFDPAISDERLEQVLRTLHLWEWVQSLPGGLSAPLGGDRGLSAGEAQLLAFARVFLRDPGLLILDEASSRLDPATEALMEQAVDRLLQGRTGVVIAHRLETVQRADDILILDEGRVVEYGPRAALASDPSSRLYRLLQTGLEGVLA